MLIKTINSIGFERVLLVACFLFLIQQTNGEDDSSKEKKYWLRQKAVFQSKTDFPLPESNVKLLGPGNLQQQSNFEVPHGHLPFWFNYDLFKRVFNRTVVEQEENMARHQVYLKTCIRVLKQRVLYRMLAGTEDTLITSDADRFADEKFGIAQENPDCAKENFMDCSMDKGTSPEGEGGSNWSTDPVLKAVELIRLEMEQVESRNQVEHYLKAFDEVDGSALAGKLPY